MDDALRKLYPEEKIYTFWIISERLCRNAGFADRFIPAQAQNWINVCLPRVDRNVRGWEKTSDHAPVWMELDDNYKSTCS